MISTALLLAADPNDGTQLTCTTAGGQSATVPDPGAGIPFLGDLLNKAGNGLSNSDCVPKSDYHIPGLIKSSADLIGSTPSPTITDTGEHAVGVTAFLSGNTSFYVVVLFVVAIAIRGAIIGWRQRWQDMEGLFQLLVSMTLIIGCGAAVVQAVLQVTDGYAPWIINLAGGGDYLTNMQNLMGDLPDPALGDIAGYALVAVAWIAAGLQWLALTTVSLLLPIAVGLWPLFASIEGVTSGKPWRTPITKYIFAMATYKFVVASMYAAAFKQIGGTAGGGNVGKGVFLLLLAALMMPMLIKAFAPYGAPAGTGISGASAVAGAAAVVATR